MLHLVVCSFDTKVDCFIYIILSNYLSDLSSLRTPVNVSETAQPVASSWFEEEIESPEGSSNKFNEGLVCSIYHILFHCSNESPGLVSFLMAIVSRYDKEIACTKDSHVLLI